MQRSRFSRSALPLIVILSALLLTGCIVTKDSPAPGCVESIGFPVLGGCSGETVILDLTVEPQNECLTIAVNNCNGGVLEVDNSCLETLILGGVEIPSSDRVSLDVIERENGTYALRGVGGNFSDYVPEEDKSIVIAGLLGDQDVKVTFTKTAPLCE